MQESRKIGNGRARWLIPVGLTLVGALIGLLVASVTPRSYTAQSELYFAANGGESITELNDAASLVRSQMTSYAELATARSVLDPVAREIEWTDSLQDLAKQVEVTVPVDTVVLKIQTKGASPEKAAALANSLTRHISEQASAISPKQQGTSVVRAALITQAAASGDASSPSRRLFTGTGAFIGLLVGCAIAAVLPGRRIRPQRSSDDDDREQTVERPADSY